MKNDHKVTGFYADYVWVNNAFIGWPGPVK